MRRNAFGEAYCHTADEARTVIDASDSGWDEVYAGHVESPDGAIHACAEIFDENGEVVCYIEAATVDDVEAILKVLQVDRQ